MSIEEARKDYLEYFAEKIEAFGASPQGVDYSSLAAQEVRFEQLAKLLPPEEPFTVIDFGCGYGAFFDFLGKENRVFTYHGADMIGKMIAAARQAHADCPNAHFTTQESNLPIADYVIAGSIFNNKFQSEVGEWTELILETLQQIDRLCIKGFAFNMLTTYSDADRIAQRPDLYFGDPCFFFDYCKRHFARNVALLHDYDLYDFTILVRKGT